MDRKKIKREQKEKTPQRGIFAVENLINHKKLIGSSANVQASLNRNRFELRQNTHKNKLLQKEFLQYGQENFEFKVLELVDKDESDWLEALKVLEMRWLEKEEPFGEKGYNEKRAHN